MRTLDCSPPGQAGTVGGCLADRDVVVTYVRSDVAPAVSIRVPDINVDTY